MTRAKLLSVLCLTLALGGLALGQVPPAQPSAAPRLEERVDKRIRLTTPEHGEEHAVILQVWRLEDGRACMQAHSLKTGAPLTIVEDETAEPALRFVCYRWNHDGTPPEGCPVPPKTAQAGVSSTILQAGGQPIAQATAPKTAPKSAAPTRQPIATATAPVAPAPSTAGLFPPGYRPAGEEKPALAAPSVPAAPEQTVVPAVVPTAAVEANQDGTVMSVETTQPAIKVEPKPLPVITPAANTVAPTTPEVPAAPVSPYTSTAKPTAARSSVSPYAAGNATMVPAQTETTIQQTSATEQTAAPAAPVKVNTAGKQIVTVHENGVERQCVVLGEDRVGGRVNGLKVQAIDNGECFTIANCKTVCAPAPAVVCPTPCATPCPPAAAPCPPPAAPCTEPTPACDACTPRRGLLENVCSSPCDDCTPRRGLFGGLCDRIRGGRDCAACTTTGPCDACASAKPCETCPAPVACEPCKTECKPCCMDRCCTSSLCERLSNCLNRPICNHRPGILDGAHCGLAHDCGSMLRVPVPHMGMRGLTPGCPPAHPYIPPYNTMESPAMRAFYGNGPAYGVTSSLQIIQQCQQWQQRIHRGIDCANDPATAESVKNTIFLMAVMQKSMHPANRVWAAERLREVQDPLMMPYAVEVLTASAQLDGVPQVRLAALNTLTAMQVDTPAVRSMLAWCCRDLDPAVRGQAVALANQLSGRPQPTETPMSTQGQVHQAEFKASPARNAMDR